MIKLCGIRRPEDIEYINAALPDYMGMILAEGFRRTVDISLAADFVKKLDGRVKKVGVFVNTPIETVKKAVSETGLDVIQLHGKEDISYITEIKKLGLPVWKAARVKSAADIKAAEELKCDMLVLDSYVEGAAGGTGVTSDWSIINNTVINTPFFLAGGITAGNLAAALEISPNVDISGGTETDGCKDILKIREIMKIYNNKRIAIKAINVQI